MRTTRLVESLFAALALIAIGASPGCDCAADPAPGGTPCSTNAECPSAMCRDGRCIPLVCETAGDCPDGAEPGCVDMDHDGYGTGCSRGADCNDSNPVQGARELCGDGADNDCDGTADEVESPLCDCGSTRCMSEPSGPGTSHPFDVSDSSPDPHDGVGLSPEGYIVLDSRSFNTHLIWIANTQEGTVSKFDTRTFEELGRYATGPRGALGARFSYFNGEDPSRTSVNTFSDVYVGNRDGRSLVKISALGPDCPDTNGDGVVTTSSGGTDVLPYGMDDCVLWRTDLPDGGYIRAVAAQDVEELDFTLHPYVWAGGWDGDVWKVDGDTGEILIHTDGPTRNYGFALDGSGNLWISGRDSRALGKIDTTRCRDDASCAAAPCMEDSCVKQIIPSPDNVNLYGITVDQEQRVWLGTYSEERVLRYDPSAGMGARWTSVNVGCSTHGITADGIGFVYAACMADGILRLAGDDPTTFLLIPGTGGFSAKGMAVDFDGKIWAINMDDSNATVVTPGPTITEATVATGIAATVVNPYTYSDMTGSQLRLATNRRGYYRHVFEGCGMEGETTYWEQLWWDADAPPGTRLSFRVRTAETRDALDMAAWVSVAMVPGDRPPVDVAGALAAAGVMQGRYLELEVTLISERDSSTEIITPVVRAFDVSHMCEAPFG